VGIAHFALAIGDQLIWLPLSTYGLDIVNYHPIWHSDEVNLATTFSDERLDARGMKNNMLSPLAHIIQYGLVMK